MQKWAFPARMVFGAARSITQYDNTMYEGISHHCQSLHCAASVFRQGMNAQVYEHTDGETRLFSLANGSSGKTPPLKSLLVKVRSTGAHAW